MLLKPLLALSVVVLQAPSTIPSPPSPTAFVDVTVIPMTGVEDRLEHQTVVVVDGRIASIGPAATARIPEGAIRIDGRGRFLIPGLSDMHAHLAGGAGNLTDAAGRQLALSTALGITTIRSLISPGSALALRERLEAGAISGPRLVLAGGSINGRSSPTGASVVERVTAQHNAGFDLVKTHGMWPTQEPYDSLVAVTARLGMPLVGHVTAGYGLRSAMSAGQQVEHLDGFIAEIVADGVSVVDDQFIFDAAALASVSDEKLQILAAEIADRGLWNAPTLELFRILGGNEPAETFVAREEMQYVHAMAVEGWANTKRQMHSEPIEPATRSAYLDLRNRIVMALYSAGAKLLASSDSPQFFMVPGWGLHRELQALQDAGLSPYDALETATSNPALWFGDDTRGFIAEGMVADLALVDGDPTVDVANAMKVAGTMIGGEWFNQERLDELKQQVKAAVGR